MRTLFNRRERNFSERLKTFHSTSRPHACDECGRETMIDIGHREPKDFYITVSAAAAGLLMLSVLGKLAGLK